MHGIERDYKNPPVRYLSPQTRVENLLLIGQNLHGIIGVSINAIVTCTELLSPNYIINKINEQESKAAKAT